MTVSIRNIGNAMNVRNKRLTLDSDGFVSLMACVVA